MVDAPVECRLELAHGNARMSGEPLRLIPGREPAAILAEAMLKEKPSKAFVLFSGGKDSSVTLEYMWRNHRKMVTGALHVNTGIGLSSTREFAKVFCESRNIPFHEAHAPLAYEDLIRRGWLSKDGTRQVGFPGPAAHRFMYSWLKERALDAFVSLQKDHRLDRIGLITGVRAEESARRMGTTLDIRRDGAQVWIAPLIDWSSYDMQAYRTTYSVPMSPASSTIHISAECLCGAFGHPRELDLIEAIYGDDPVCGRLRKLEKEMESDGVARCKWAANLPGDPVPIEPPGPLCVGCYKVGAA